jgi:hypothetical protein
MQNEEFRTSSLFCSHFGCAVTHGKFQEIRAKPRKNKLQTNFLNAPEVGVSGFRWSNFRIRFRTSGKYELPD